MTAKKATTSTPSDEDKADATKNPPSEVQASDARVDSQDAVASEEDTEYVPQHVVDGGRDYRVLDDDGKPQDVSGYIGVDPEYMTYADETQKPFLTDQERFTYTNQYDHLVGNADEEVDNADAKDATTDPAPVDENKRDDDGDDFALVK